MFAFAIWDAAAGSLFLARDPMGMKPLYYALLPQGLFFASEIKAFLALPFFEARINRHSLRQFLEFGYVFHERESSLDGVCKLPPGRFLKVDRGLRPTEVAYFEPPIHVESGEAGHSDGSVRQLSETLSAVVAQHLVADVPVGLLLSGGLDSSLIAAIASRHAKVTTLCMGFAESTIDEREHARAVAKHIGSEHIELLIKPSDVFEGLEDSVWTFDDLFGDWGTLTTRLLYRECRSLGIKVVLVGEGSDELFGGYSSRAQFDTMRGPLAWKMLRIYRWYSGRRYGRLMPEFSATWRAYLEEEGGDHFYAKRKFESRNQLPNNYVMKVDKASMSAGVEARAPFLDRRVAELAYRMSKEELLSETENKVALRTIARRDNLLPNGIASRTKFGASIAASWMDDSKEFRAYARETILARDGWVDDLGLRKAMTAYFDRGRTGYRFPHPIGIFSNCAWRLLLLTLWSRLYLSRAHSVRR
jgi:asparagine synthase (glutamine-hydrolysing)